MSAPQINLDTLPGLTACDREPIHIPGAVEPNGVLLVVQEPELTIVQVSANAHVLLGADAQSLLGTALAHVLEPQSLALFRQRILPADLQGKRRYLSGIRLQTSTSEFDSLVHRHDGVLLMELEPACTEQVKDSHPDFYGSLTDAVADLDGPMTLVELCQRVVTHIRRLTGFDRVMIYRFLEDDSGSVLAEDSREDMTSYLGLRYPASDIPAQARRMYLLNTLRLKSDVNAQRSPMMPPLNPVTGQPLDMSHCVLRAMSPVHDEYLRNMGVTASMSVSIVRDERLWGLIACHHSEPKIVPHGIRVSCEVLARVFSANIASAEVVDRHRRAGTIYKYRDALSERLHAHRNVLNVLIGEGERLTSAVNAAGAAFCLGGKVALVGSTPPLPEVEALVKWLDSNQERYVLATDKLSVAYGPAEALTGTATGLLSARIALGSSDFLLWFRPANVEVVEWAGNPAKPVEETEAGKRISPRRSFERWKETVGDHSDPWQDYEREFALSLRQISAEVLLLEKYEEITHLNLELGRSNIELDAFAYAASHDLQEPIRTIRAYAQLLQRRVGPKLDEDARNLLSGIEAGGKRMGELVSALLTYGQVGGSALREREPVPLEDLMRAVLMNLHESIRLSKATITHEVLPTVHADREQIMQLLQNLIGNSIKYRRPEEPPQIHISAHLQHRTWNFTVQDNGQGFRPEQADLIFGAFKRLHGRDIPGTGIGLALCKRIVEHHGGRIWAESSGSNQGATFRFTLPKSQS